MQQIGSLDPEELWMHQGESVTDRWSYSQLTISSQEGAVIKVIFEAEVGIVDKGDIAIDTIVFKQGSCPRNLFLLIDILCLIFYFFYRTPSRNWSRNIYRRLYIYSQYL